MLPHGAPALAQWLSERLGEATPEMGRDLHDVVPQRRAAVLIGIVAHEQGPTVLLTRRASHLRKHPGQICFPGGAIDPEDAGAEAAALREAREEIGLLPEYVQIVGELGGYVTASAYRVAPIVALIRPGFTLQPDPQEVAEIFELPLAALLDLGRYERRWVVRADRRVRAHFIELEGVTVWGATAAMLLGLGRLLGASGAPTDTDKVHLP